jgi:hypothetical protein
MREVVSFLVGLALGVGLMCAAIAVKDVAKAKAKDTGDIHLVVPAATPLHELGITNAPKKHGLLGEAGR